MVFSADAESGFGHLRPEPGGVLLDSLDEAGVRRQHVEDLKRFGGESFLGAVKMQREAVISAKLLSIN